VLPLVTFEQRQQLTEDARDVATVDLVHDEEEVEQRRPAGVLA
jgi:hypothetical protein